MTENELACVFCEKMDAESRRNDPRWIADLQVSTALVSDNQVCRGYTVLVYNKAHVTELFQLEREDLIAYSEDLAKVAKAIYHAYHPHKINYELLGNVVPHLHWHIIPRQKTDPVDSNWPIWGRDFKKVRLSDNEYSRIIEEIRRHLK
jgi:diadenosine tetraphosphate (Ap4A) HIT family hydrolase